jgi:HEAT repeat protein
MDFRSPRVRIALALAIVLIIALGLYLIFTNPRPREADPQLQYVADMEYHRDVPGLTKVALDQSLAYKFSVRAIGALERVEHKAAGDVFAKALTDPRAQVRTAAVEAIGGTDDGENMAGVIDLFEKDPSVDVRCEAAGALGRLAHEGYEQAVYVLYDALSADQPPAVLKVAFSGIEKALVIRFPDFHSGDPAQIRQQALEKIASTIYNPAGRGGRGLAILGYEKVHTDHGDLHPYQPQ